MIAPMFDQAVKMHRAGRLAEAEALYRRLLARDARHVDALHLLGVIAAQTGRAEEGEGLIRQAVALSPHFALAHFNHGNALRDLSRLDEAAAAYRTAAQLDPEHVGAWINLGVALLGLGRLAEAIAALGEAVRRKPDHFEALIHLGAALRSAGRSAEALAAYGRAAQIRPDRAEGCAGVGVVLQDLGRYEAAVCAHRGALARRPGDVAELVRLAGALHGSGRSLEAADAYRAALDREPDRIDALVGMAVALQEVGEAEAARSRLRHALSIDPTCASAWFVLSDLKTFAAGDADIAQMERVAAEATASLDDRIDLAFALGKAWMDAGDGERAFARLTQANHLQRARFTYDVEADARRLAAIGRVFTAEAMAPFAGAGAGAACELPVFVVGMPRSGTTLVEQILASHAAVHGAGELTLLGETVGALTPALHELRLAELSRATVESLGRRYVERLAALAPAKRRIVDKMPANFQFAGMIALMLPGARIIHCRRNPADTCLSCYARKFAGRQDFAYDLRELGLYYRAYDALMAVWRERLGPDRFLEVAYEDLVADLERQARRLVDFCGLDWDPACLDFHQTRRPVRTASVNQVRRPIYSASSGRWRAYAAHLQPLLDALGDLAPPA